MKISTVYKVVYPDGEHLVSSFVWRRPGVGRRYSMEHWTHPMPGTLLAAYSKQVSARELCRRYAREDNRLQGWMADAITVPTMTMWLPYYFQPDTVRRIFEGWEVPRQDESPRGLITANVIWCKKIRLVKRVA